jgi:hypothetical protein
MYTAQKACHVSMLLRKSTCFGACPCMCGKKTITAGLSGIEFALIVCKCTGQQFGMTLNLRRCPAVQLNITSNVKSNICVCRCYFDALKCNASITPPVHKLLCLHDAASNASAWVQAAWPTMDGHNHPALPSGCVVTIRNSIHTLHIVYTSPKMH